MEQGGTVQAPTTGLSMANRHLPVRRVESELLSSKTDQEIETAINRVLFHKQCPAHIKIMDARRNANGVITAIMH